MTTCDKILIGMSFGFKKQKRASIKSISDYKNMEMLVKQGRDQFRRLIEKGINVPVALL